MIRTGITISACAFLVVCAAAQTQRAPQTPVTASAPGTAAQTETSADLPSGTALNAQLNSSVDSKKAKVGDRVEAHATEEFKYAGKTIIPVGAKLEGHVTEATARSKGDNKSTLAIQFEKAILKKGEEIPLRVAILAIAAPQNDFSGGSPGPGSDPMGGAGAAAAGGSPMGASRPQSPATVAPGYPGGNSGSQNGSSMGANGTAQLSASSRGVFGMSGLELMASNAGGNESTVITSSGKNVRLDSGTRLLLVSQPSAAAAVSK